MSDMSQGPGWWMASDGKWYAPELHPDAVARRAAAEQSAQAPAQTQAASPAGASSAGTAPARQTPDHIVGTTSRSLPAGQPARGGFGGRELLLVALAAFLVGGLAGFGGSRLLAEGSTVISDTEDSDSTSTTRTRSDTTGDTEQSPGEAEGADDPASDREAKSQLRRAFSAAKVLSTDWDGKWSVDAADTPIDPAALARLDPDLSFVPAGGAAPGAVSVRVESVDAPNSDLWLATAGDTETFYCIHATSAGAVFYGSGESEDQALANCVNETW